MTEETTLLLFRQSKEGWAVKNCKRSLASISTYSASRLLSPPLSFRSWCSPAEASLLAPSSAQARVRYSPPHKYGEAPAAGPLRAVRNESWLVMKRRS